MGLDVVYVTGEATPELKSSVCTGQYQMVLISPELLVENRYWRKMLTSAVYTTRLIAIVNEAYYSKRICCMGGGGGGGRRGKRKVGRCL